jgi:hypothetical protein
VKVAPSSDAQKGALFFDGYLPGVERSFMLDAIEEVGGIEGIDPNGVVEVIVMGGNLF